MSGIIINEMENVDEELTEQELERLNFKKLREAIRKRYSTEIEELNKANQQKQNTKNQTGVSVTSTPNGTVTTKTTTQNDGSKTEETEEIDSNVDTVDDDSGTGFDTDFQKDATKKGIDTSDVKDGKQENIPGKPDNPADTATDASKNRNSANGLKNGEHCATDEPAEEATGEELDQQPDGLEGTESAEKQNCIDPDATGLNDLQKEVVWVAIDMLKWQPLTDKDKKLKDENGRARKRKWELILDTDAFYSNYEYPNDPSFGMHSDMKGFPPQRRLKKFYEGMIDKDSSKIKNYPGSHRTETHWCAETLSVIYCFAMASLEVKHKTKNDKGTLVSINSYKNNPNKIPFTRNSQSSASATLQVTNWGAPASWEPTVGSIFFRSQSSGGNCGHAGIVLLVTEDKSIVTIEGNASDDLSLKYYKRGNYYARQSTGGLNHCHVGNPKSTAYKVAPLPFPTKSKWHELFVNPALNENLEWTKKPSRDGNPLIELKSLLNGFYNPTGTKGADFETEVN